MLKNKCIFHKPSLSFFRRQEAMKWNVNSVRLGLMRRLFSFKNQLYQIRLKSFSTNEQKANKIYDTDEDLSIKQNQQNFIDYILARKERLNKESFVKYFDDYYSSQKLNHLQKVTILKGCGSLLREMGIYDLSCIFLSSALDEGLKDNSINISDIYDILAANYTEMKDFKQSLHFLQKAHELNPNSPDLKLKIGFCYMQLGKNEQAKEAFKEIILVDKDVILKVDLLHIVGKSLEILEDYESAIKVFKKALEKSSANFPTFAFLSYLKCLLKTKQLDKELPLLCTFLNKETILNGISVFRSAKDTSKEKLTFLEKSSEILPENIFVLKELSDAYNSQNLLKEAKATLEKAFKLDPNDPMITFPLVSYFIYFKEHDKAIEMIKRNVNLTKETSNLPDDIYLTCGNFMLRTGNLYEATFYLDKVKEKSNQTLLDLADCFAQLNNLDKAYEIAQVAYIKYKNVDSVISFAKICDAKGNHIQANEALLKSYQENPKNYKLCLHLGLNFHLQKQTDQAINCLKESYDLNPQNSNVCFYLGTILLDLKDKSKNEESIRYLREAIRLNPNNEAYHLTLGRALMQIQNFPQAAESLKKTLALNPTNLHSISLLLSCLKVLKLEDEYNLWLRKAKELDPAISP